MSKIIEQIEKEQLKSEVAAFAPGDTVIVNVKVKEGERERIQAYEGVVIAVRNQDITGNNSDLEKNIQIEYIPG